MIPQDVVKELRKMYGEFTFYPDSIPMGHRGYANRSGSIAIDLYGVDISDLKGIISLLKKIPNLEYANLGNNRIKNITPIILSFILSASIATCTLLPLFAAELAPMWATSILWE